MPGSQSPVQPAPSLELVSSCFSPSVNPSTFWDQLCQLLVLTFLLFFSGNTNSIFALDYISGALTLNGPLDRENPFYSAGFILTVKVSPPPARKHMDRAGWGGHPAWGQLLPGSAANLGYVVPWASRAMMCWPRQVRC